MMCQKYGMDLAILEDELELKHVNAFIKDKGKINQQ
jgi:hypothetical protein